MAKAQTKATPKKAPERDPDMPEGFETLGRTRVQGWFVREAGNKIQGTLKDSFTVKSKDRRFPDKKVYVIDITEGETDIMNAERNPETITQGTVGIDETGYLKKLSDLEKDREVFIKCKGKEDPGKKDSPWVFVIGVVPF